MMGPAQGTGIFFDGRSGQRQTVAVTLEDVAIAIASLDGAPIARWSYTDVERLAAPQHRLRLGIGKDSTARLSLPDPVFAEATKEHLGVLTIQVQTAERRRRHKVVEWSIAAVAAVLILGIVGMPSLAELLLPLVPLTAEKKVGEQVEAAVRNDFKGPGPFACGTGENEKEGQAVFLKVIGKLEAVAALPVPLRPFVVRDPKTINAGAAPGGLVLVYQGLIDFADTPEELVGVLAHELGHVAHRDTMRKQLHDAGITYLFGLVLGDFFGSAAMVFNGRMIANARYSRFAEASADAYGVALITKAGGDPHQVAAMFEHLRQKRLANSAALLATHPMHEERIAAIKAAPAVANPIMFVTPAEWQALKRICADTKTAVVQWPPLGGS
jgi:Zn-dependent protease with chaperone function